MVGDEPDIVDLLGSRPRPESAGPAQAAPDGPPAAPGHETPARIDTGVPARPAPGARDPCHICGAPGKRQCTGCDKSSCGAHLWTMLGLCTQCARSDRMARFHRAAEPEERNWLEG